MGERCQGSGLWVERGRKEEDEAEVVGGDIFARLKAVIRQVGVESSLLFT